MNASWPLAVLTAHGHDLVLRSGQRCWQGCSAWLSRSP